MTEQQKNFAQASRESVRPKECHGGLDCWVEDGTLRTVSSSGVLARCLDCRGRIGIPAHSVPRQAPHRYRARGTDGVAQRQP